MGLNPEGKGRFLKALEEDWEFRNAVMGLLGIQELRAKVNDLARDVKVTLETVTMNVEVKVSNII